MTAMGEKNNRELAGQDERRVGRAERRTRNETKYIVQDVIRERKMQRTIREGSNKKKREVDRTECYRRGEDVKKAVEK